MCRRPPIRSRASSDHALDPAVPERVRDRQPGDPGPDDHHPLDRPGQPAAGRCSSCRRSAQRPTGLRASGAVPVGPSAARAPRPQESSRNRRGPGAPASCRSRARPARRSAATCGRRRCTSTLRALRSGWSMRADRVRDHHLVEVGPERDEPGPAARRRLGQLGDDVAARDAAGARPGAARAGPAACRRAARPGSPGCARARRRPGTARSSARPGRPSSARRRGCARSRSPRRSPRRRRRAGAATSRTSSVSGL